LLKEAGTKLFSRFFLALINQAAAQRSITPESQRLPCYVEVDECHNYIKNDPKIQVILAEARQQKVAVVLAHQFLSQIDPRVRTALAANTGIKMAARLEGTDPATMARDMNTVPDFIRDQTVGSFAVFIRDPTPTLLSMLSLRSRCRASPTCARTNKRSFAITTANAMRGTSPFPTRRPNLPISLMRRRPRAEPAACAIPRTSSADATGGRPPGDPPLNGHRS
jgi:hypothetical protein